MMSARKSFVGLIVAILISGLFFQLNMKPLGATFALVAVIFFFTTIIVSVEERK
jgi:uncharacterized membrane protein YccC